ncbi:MAG: dicarboxylate/amino acid:cation symporter [Desulfuromonadales bacterium]|nr:dicarboxylate/amino acid:cation symporter [Desulfuromonadales bacterium]
MVSKRANKAAKKNLLLNPWVALGGMLAGAVFGLYFRSFSYYLGSVGKLYMALLGMGVLPIILTATVSGIGRLLKSGTSGRYIRRLLAVFSGGVILASLVGVAAGIIGRPGLNLDDQTQAELGSIFLRAEIYSSTENASPSANFFEFLHKMVPDNFFSSLSEGQTLSVVLVSILLGCAVGLSQKKSSQMVLDGLDIYYDAFLKIIGWVLYALPVGLFCFSAGQVATVGLGVFVALGKFILVFYLACYFMCFLYSLVIWRSTDLSLIQSLLKLKEPLIMAFGTRSSIATLPVALRCLNEDLNIDREVCDMVVPLGVVLNKHSFPLCFSLTASYVAQLYLLPLSFSQYALIVLTSTLVGMAASGPPLVVAAMVAFVLGPVGLPVEIGVIMLAAAGPIIEPIITVLNIHAPCAAACLIDRQGRRLKKRTEPIIAVGRA